jgi:hypothetical protein
VRKVLFLDIDGVMNNDKTPEWENFSNWVLDDENITQLKRIIEATHAEIVLSSTVLSSTWRLSEKRIAFINDKIAPIKIVDTTPLRFSERYRKYEIREWLVDQVDPNAESWNFDFSKILIRWAVLDDDRDADLEDGSFFKTNFYEGGLTKDIADQVIAYLNKE